MYFPVVAYPSGTLIMSCISNIYGLYTNNVPTLIGYYPVFIQYVTVNKILME